MVVHWESEGEGTDMVKAQTGPEEGQMAGRCGSVGVGGVEGKLGSCRERGGR